FYEMRQKLGVKVFDGAIKLRTLQTAKEEGRIVMAAEELSLVAGGDSANIQRDLMKRFSSRTGLTCLFFLLFSIQIAISAGSYSGRHSPPMFGDFEAQRHWMEITVNLPLKQWYVNGSDNDLSYWGLDYPPLTALHSYILGKISEEIDPSWVALFKSRGVESESHKLFMRLSVLVSMWILYIPAIVTFVYLSSCDQKVYYSAVAVLYPALIAMDNGHFQYNHISLGLFLLAVICFIRSWRVAGSIFFVMAVNFKQMELYHSLPVAVFLLATSLPPIYNAKNLCRSFTELAKLLVVVVSTFLLLWSPFIASGADLKQIMHRIFPFYRGIFEDKVANVWCTVNVVIKLNKYHNTHLLKLSTALVICTHIPSLCALFLRPSISMFKRTLFISSLSFFLFSFQVHEKSILLPAVAALLIWPERRVAISWFLIISNASVFPLCVKDGNALHLAMFISYAVILYPNFSKLTPLQWLVVQSSCAIGVTVCIASVVVSPPTRYPHLFSLFNAVFCFIHFAALFAYFNYVVVKECYVCGRDRREKLH
uniref:Alpha-1,3-glucosyltransferase n=2 Tax=Parascaris univalens TaxID=6257 RepID=A0A915B6L8_PARUN